ncbi:hypothetical protein [Mumia zhuanghuii]|uniref:Uncharacterized protein n=1 Tax=Mumia zhuanghuii TaxID=2585211 RepID=A0A5C4LTK7_9ACTN|nr:hypothetical protein [Mumia zhuanghuii]TNC22438.1 hypothetical protein FHE65_35750 [Mumia zhuanghuii]
MLQHVEADWPELVVALQHLVLPQARPASEVEAASARLRAYLLAEVQCGSDEQPLLVARLAAC